MKKLDLAALKSVAGGTSCAPACPPPACPPPAPSCNQGCKS